MVGTNEWEYSNRVFGHAVRSEHMLLFIGFILSPRRNPLVTATSPPHQLVKFIDAHPPLLPSISRATKGTLNSS